MARKKKDFYLVCTINLGSEVLFTVPLSIMKKFDWDRWTNIRFLRSIIEVFTDAGREPGSIDFFRYDPASGSFAVRAQTAGVITGYFLKDRPWINEFEEPKQLQGFLIKKLGVPAGKLNRRKMEEEAEKVGSREVRIPSVR